MIGIIDYGSGNVRAFANAYKLLDIPAVIVRSVAELARASRLIIPGVGAFDHAMRCLQASGMRDRIEELVLGKQVPVLGVCVGVQIFMSASEEGKLPGLGWVPGMVRRFDTVKLHGVTAVPHMGWNEVRPRASTGLLAGLNDESRFYFLHSYYVECERDEDALAVTDYGGDFACAVRRGNIYGVQFHPEKSHHNGIRLLKNFAEVQA